MFLQICLVGPFCNLCKMRGLFCKYVCLILVRFAISVKWRDISAEMSYAGGPFRNFWKYGTVHSTVLEDCFVFSVKYGDVSANIS